MKRLLVITTTLFFLTSCSMHVCVTKSNPNISKENQYVFENDTIRISYDFWAQRGQPKFTIYNKLNVPIFIDWKNSALIINDTTIPYWKDKTVQVANTNGSYGGGYINTHSNGASIKADRISFIPIHAQILKTTKSYLCPYRASSLDINKHFRNFIAYSTEEDFKNEKFIDNDFEIIEVKKTNASKFRKWKDPRNFYTDK